MYFTILSHNYKFWVFLMRMSAEYLNICRKIDIFLVQKVKESEVKPIFYFKR